ILAVFVISCKSQKTDTSTNSEMLESGNYQVISLEDKEDISAEELSLNIDLEKNTISGFAGCNNFSAGLKVDEKTIETGGARATLMHCEGQMELERGFVDNLEKSTTYHLENGELSLKDKEGKTLIKAKRMKNELKGGTYKVLSVAGKSVDEDQGASFEINTEKNRISGTTGCNTFGNEYEQDGDKIEMNYARVTKMYCEGKMEFERELLGNLKNVETFSYHKNILEFRSAEGHVLISAELTKE